MALLFPACAYKRASLSAMFSVPSLAPQVQLFCEQNPSRESLLQHRHTCEALALLNYTSIA